MTFKEIVLSSSQTPFVVVGSNGGYDTVIARSQDAPLELIGYALEAHPQMNNSSSLASLFSNRSSRQFNIARSSKNEDVNPREDERGSAYRFAWIGGNDKQGVAEVNALFDRTVPELVYGVRESDARRVEMAMARLIMLTSFHNERRLGKRRQVRLFAGIYILTIVIASIAFGFKEFLRLLLS